jgi:hypothetical protein
MENITVSVTNVEREKKPENKRKWVDDGAR